MILISQFSYYASYKNVTQASHQLVRKKFKDFAVFSGTYLYNVRHYSTLQNSINGQWCLSLHSLCSPSHHCLANSRTLDLDVHGLPGPNLFSRTFQVLEILRKKFQDSRRHGNPDYTYPKGCFHKCILHPPSPFHAFGITPSLQTSVHHV